MNNENAAGGYREARRQSVTALSEDALLQCVSPAHMAPYPTPASISPALPSFQHWHEASASCLPSLVPLRELHVCSPVSRPCRQSLFQKGAHRHWVSSAVPPARHPALGWDVEGGELDLFDGKKYRPCDVPPGYSVNIPRITWKSAKMQEPSAQS